MFYITKTNLILLVAIAIAVQAITITPASAQSAANVSSDSNVAINGYDPVAFFTMKKPVNGDFNTTSTHEGATYFCANREHKTIFDANPVKYAPQFGGYCAFGVSVGALLPVDINTWQVRNDKLYLNLNPQILEMFNKDIDAHIAKADKNWPALSAKPAGDLVNTSGKSKVAVDGYDPVAFFTMNKPTHGNFQISSQHRGATYFFVNKEHKAMFDGNPEKYAPQYGGFCAFGASVGALFPVDISTWQVRNEKLNLNLNPQILEMFNKDIDAHIAKANTNWPGLVAKNLKK